ncbi:DUF2079 domain-containing protein [Kitasatospora sp. NPDC006697]|uniref:DUF2079 domain-containing protein n=1 Tax=Kitasatospora sp. NPDC006697 TaxID=3364020 RepID=UPI00368EA261
MSTQAEPRLATDGAPGTEGAVLRRLARLPRPSRRTLLLTLLCFAVTFGTGMRAWSSVGLGGFDLGIFDQGVRGYAHFGLPVSTLKWYHHEFPPGFSLLGDHFSPVLALLSPLYWIWDDPRSLLLGQALLFAAGVPLIRRIARHSFAHADQPLRDRAADLAGLVYGLGWPLLVASQVGFHEVGFAVPLTLLMLERGLQRRYGAVLVAAVLLCCTKEDLGLSVSAYGAVLLWRNRRDPLRRRDRLVGAVLAVLGVTATVVAVQWAIPAMGGEPGYYWNYQTLGPNASGAVRNVLHDPWLLVHASTDHALKPLLVLWLFGTLAALPLRSATVWCAVPLLAERLLSTNPNHWSVARHYDAFLWPVLLTAALEVLGRIHARGRQKRARRLGVSLAAVSLLASIPLGLVELAIPSNWTAQHDEKSLIKAASLIPDGAWVEADNQIAPRLTPRTHVVLVDQTPRGCEYVLIRSKNRSFPFASPQEQAERVQLLLANGYQQVWSSADGGVLLLHRVGDQPIPGEHVPGPGSRPIQDVVPGDVGHDLFKG